MTRVPRSSRSISSIVNSPSPSDSQTTAASASPGSPRVDADFVRDDECRIKADPELADKLRVALLVARHLLEELGRSGSGNSAEIVDQLVARHADAVVDDGERFWTAPSSLDAYREFGIVSQKGGVFASASKPQLVSGIRRIGNQLTKEDFLVAVE